MSQPLRWPRKTGLSMHYRGVTGLERFGEMHIADGLYAGLAILESGLTNVTIVARVRDIEARTGSIDDFLADAIQRMPGVAEKLEGAERIDGIRGVGSMGCRSRRIVGDGYLLIGDAASFLDPFAGEGIYEALRGGLLAAPVAHAALQAKDTSADALDAYRVARRHTFTAKRSVSWIVQGFVNSPPLMNYVTSRLDRRDDLGVTISGVLGSFRPATQVLSPIFLARLLRP
jgi:flavin-dependent dehydrogenase